MALMSQQNSLAFCISLTPHCLTHTYTMYIYTYMCITESLCYKAERKWQTTSVFFHWEHHKQSVSQSVQSLRRVQLFVTSWIAAHQASLSITNSWSSPKLMSIESVMPSNHLILYHPLLLLPSIFPSIRVFSMSRLFTSDGQSIGASAPASVLPMNIQCWSPLGWTGWISLQSKGLTRVFSNTTVQKHQFFGAQLSL